MLSIIERHCIYTRKGMLALIVLDFYQLISNPLEFKEYTAMCNQLKRGLVMLAIVTVILLFSYVKFVLQLINFEMDLVFAQNLLGWMMKKQFAADLITSSLFYFRRRAKVQLGKLRVRSFRWNELIVYNLCKIIVVN